MVISPFLLLKYGYLPFLLLKYDYLPFLSLKKWLPLHFITVNGSHLLTSVNYTDPHYLFDVFVYISRLIVLREVYFL